MPASGGNNLFDAVFSMRGVHRDFETLAFRQSRASHRVIQFDLVNGRRSTKGAADESRERLAHGGFGPLPIRDVADRADQQPRAIGLA